jgi:hypothetical protein
METFLLAFGLVLLSVLGLALGVIFGRSPLKGSCGGLGLRHRTFLQRLPQGAAP